MVISFLFPNLCPDNFSWKNHFIEFVTILFLFDVLDFWSEAHGISAPQSQMEPVPHALGGASLTTGHPRKCLYSCHSIQSYLIIWPFDFPLHNLLTHSLKTLCNISYLEHVLLCANSKCVFQASTVTLCDRQDLVSFLSGTQLWAWWWAQGRPVAPRLLSEWTRVWIVVLAGEGMVYV